MDKEISRDLFEVAEPVFQSFDDIAAKYIGNGVVITNMEPSERGSGDPCKGGVVRYYTKTSKKYTGNGLNVVMCRSTATLNISVLYRTPAR